MPHGQHTSPVLSNVSSRNKAGGVIFICTAPVALLSITYECGEEQQALRRPLAQIIATAFIPTWASECLAVAETLPPCVPKFNRPGGPPNQKTGGTSALRLDLDINTAKEQAVL